MLKAQPNTTNAQPAALYEFRGPIFVGDTPLEYSAGDILSAADLEGVNIKAQVSSGALRLLSPEEAAVAQAQIDAQAGVPVVPGIEDATAPAEAVTTEPVVTEPAAVETVTTEPVVAETTPVETTPPAPAEATDAITAAVTEPDQSEPIQNPGSGTRKGRSW